MTDSTPPPAEDPYARGSYPPPAYGSSPAYPQGSPQGNPGELGKVRGTFVTILLMIITFGIYRSCTSTRSTTR